ncbi:hypothetical protein Pcinc_004403 [Petrolisthes cinctipes]|uniref:Uncharacterized protein n=1 Tax=Petrolisthes cinctipes TaxID=88211 RepID=A0AAE1L3Q6_PETCI|nr:hypothetical protein Pcinc_004403 [Petrolisthes cinctipes]
MIWQILFSVWERVVEEAGAIKKGTEWLIQDPRRGSQFIYFGAKAPDFYTSDSNQTQPDRQTNSTSSPSSSTTTTWNSLTKPFTGSIGVDITSEKKLILLTSNEARGEDPEELAMNRLKTLGDSWVGNSTDMVAVVVDMQLHKQDDNVFVQIRVAYERQGEMWALSSKVKAASLRAFIIYPDEDVIKQASQTTAYLFRDNRSYRTSAALIAVLTITVL